MEDYTRPPAWKRLLAFAIIYFVWGSTFLAIRVGVREVPPFLLAAIRFLIAGLLIYGWMVARGERSPGARQWTSAFLLAILIFVMDYGLLFWAEQSVPSGIAAVMLATIPAFMALAEIILLRTQHLTAALAFALIVGLGSVVLTIRCLNVGGAAWFALAYLIVAGSILGFTAYVWLLHHESPTNVGTYGYVNPVVAVLVGYFLGGEALGARTILGTLLVLVSIVLITTIRVKKPAPSLSAQETA